MKFCGLGILLYVTNYKCKGNLQSKKEISYGRKKLSVKRAEEQADKLYRKQSDKQGNSFKQQDEE
jgi:hypothetical protein